MRFTRLYKKTIQEIYDFDIVLFQIYWSTSAPTIIKIELGLTKLLQK